MARRAKDEPAPGLVLVDKPAGWTSHDVVGRMRRLAGTRKVGHAGTLDPAATGLLVIAFGEATKTVSYVMDGIKNHVDTLVTRVFDMPSRRRTGKKTVYQYDADEQP